MHFKKRKNVKTSRINEFISQTCVFIFYVLGILWKDVMVWCNNVIHLLTNTWQSILLPIIP